MARWSCSLPGGVRARARARPTHRCPFCEKLYRRLDHYQAHLHHAHEAELDRAAEWEGAPAEASGMSTTDEGTHDVFKHADRPIRTSPIPAADVAASGAGDSATAQEATTTSGMLSDRTGLHRGEHLIFSSNHYTRFVSY